MRKSTRLHKKPAWIDNYVTNTSAANAVQVIDHDVTPTFYYFMASLNLVPDHVSFQQAIQHPHWIEAMNQELTAVEGNKTWTVTTLPAGKKAIGCKCLYKTKYSPNGSIERYKSRLVVLGCKQVYSIDYSETFAPIAKLTTVCALLAIAAIREWHTLQMDVSNAFLNGELDEQVFMKFPPRYTGLGSRIKATPNVTATTTLICMLLKSLYSLKQAPRQWFSKLSSMLLGLHYT